MPRPLCLAALILACLPPLSAVARTKLAALPARDAVVLRMDHPDATLVEEERVLTLQQGENQVDFSWQGVTIDPDSIRIAFLDHPDLVTLLSVAYPPGEAALLWRIHSAEAREERVRIAYLLANVDRLVTYKAVADTAETRVDLEAFLVLRNFSGEDFAQARVDAGVGEPVRVPSSHEETRQLALFRASGVPIRKTFTWDAAALPWEPKRLQQAVGIPVHYEIVNVNLVPTDGEPAPLWAGKVRVFQQDGRGGTIFLGEDRGELTPPGEKLRVYVGDSRDVVVTQRKLHDRQINPRPSKATVRLYDTDELLVTEVENFKDRPAVVDLVQHIPGQWEVAEASQEFERKDASTAVFPVEVPAQGRTEVRFRYHRRNVRP
ncbi:MAG: hypothetical protein P1P84_18295 [Deferrisomatales bacterium]|nr:hypothetical protein [Deferrisomatales bacterium]